MNIMSNEKQLIRWERHYSDGSVEYTDEESTKNFESNLNSVGGLIASRGYMQMQSVEWHERKAENLPISGISSRKVLGFNSCASVVKSMPMDQAIQMIKSDITGKPQTSEIEGELVVTLM
jgi:hypothetical protein